MFKRRNFCSKYITLQTTLAAEAHLAEGQFLLEEQTLNIEKSLIYRAGTRRPTVSKTEGQYNNNNNNNNNNSILYLFTC
jgi:hypothetical protein